jgi:ketosteroid isomerase-like protein
MSQQDVDTIRGAYQAFARQDIPGVLEVFDDEIQWDVPATVPFGGVYSGKEEVGGFFARLPEYLEELNVEPDDFYDAGNHVIAVGRHHGRAQGGEPFETRFAMVWEMTGGKATRFKEYTDMAPIVKALEAQVA